jgi:hypothetical protein
VHGWHLLINHMKTSSSQKKYCLEEMLSKPLSKPSTTSLTGVVFYCIMTS